MELLAQLRDSANDRINFQSHAFEGFELYVTVVLVQLVFLWLPSFVVFIRYIQMYDKC